MSRTRFKIPQQQIFKKAIERSDGGGIDKIRTAGVIVEGR